MASHEVWHDFEALRHSIKNYTVDKLKQIITGMNEECGCHFSKAGKKQELIERIGNTLDSYKLQGAEDKWLRAKAVLYQVRNSGMYTPTRIPGSISTSSATHSYYPGTSTMGKPQIYANQGSGNIVRYDPYAPPRKPIPGPSISAPPKVNIGQRPTLHFKESPFFRVDQAVSTVAECPESTSATDRRQASVMFSLTSEQINKLKPAGTKYQLRLFCTSSSFYSPNPSFRTNTAPALMEFPPTCEVRINSVQLTANLKGVKKKPGTAPPPDLGKYVRLSSTQNRVEMVYVNSQQPVQPKKFYLVVMLVETTSVDELVLSVKETSYRSREEVQRNMKATLAEDDDIVAGPQKMSLKCPLMFSRVNTPCRSSKCVHPQCFDATGWFAINEQTTLWLCPVCERVLDIKDLIIDGYFDEILKQTSDDVEDVMVEADGEWHTPDNKYGSASWLAAHPPISTKPSGSKPPSSKPQTQSSSKVLNGSDVNGKAKANNVEILILDSDDDDEDEENLVKRELSPSFAPSSQSQPPASVPQQSQYSDVIDLTLSDDEDAPAPPRKRTADEAGLQTNGNDAWKRSRMNIEQLTNAVDYSDPYGNLPPPRPSVLPPPPPPPRYNTTSYSTATGALSPDPYGSPTTTNHRLPSLSSSTSYHLNGAWR